METPASADDLYLAQGPDVDEMIYRPEFTGDVFRLQDGKLVSLIQHPCAMRRGPVLVDRLLVAEVRKAQGRPRRDWSTGEYRRMFLPELDGSHYQVEFDTLDVLPRTELEAAQRRVILSQYGVNLLVQRWLHHNSRVVIPTITIDKQTAPPFEEAELMGDACTELVNAGILRSDAVRLVDAWLGTPYADDSSSYRDLLSNAQERSTVRRALRRQVRDWIAEHKAA